MTAAVTVPLRTRDGVIVAHAVVDSEDRRFVGNWEWRPHSAGYAQARIDGQKVLLHRRIMGLTPGDGFEVDHRDGDCLNCRRSNMRVVTHAQNLQNYASRCNSTSRYRGVSWNKGTRKWRAQAKSPGGTNMHLGYFEDELEAAMVASEFRLTHMPFTMERDAPSSRAGAATGERRKEPSNG